MKKFLVFIVITVSLLISVFGSNKVVAQEYKCCLTLSKDNVAGTWNLPTHSVLGYVISTVQDEFGEDFKAVGCNPKPSDGCNEVTSDFGCRSIITKVWDAYSPWGDGFKAEDCKSVKEVEINCTADYQTGFCIPAIQYWKKFYGVGECHNKNDPEICNKTPACFWSNSQGVCFDLYSDSDCSRMNKEIDCMKSEVCSWDFETRKCIDKYQKNLREVYGDQSAGKFMPKCAAYGTCNSFGDILEVPLLYAAEMFKYLGALAFVFFIIGGGIMIFSFGNQEKVTKGKQILVAAVVGLVIAFGAYFIVTFIVGALGVSSQFRP